MTQEGGEEQKSLRGEKEELLDMGKGREGKERKRGGRGCIKYSYPSSDGRRRRRKRSKSKRRRRSMRWRRSNSASLPCV